jgi:endo-1,4-beta-xylanase
LALSRRSALAAGLALLAGRPALADAQPLKSAAAAGGRLYGAAVEPEHLTRDRPYADLVARHCAVLTPENAMKWDALRPAAGLFDFARADQVVNLAEAFGAAVHGHCLVWHEAQPSWLQGPLSAPAAAEALQVHIAGVVGRYAGRLRSWDVVNELVERNDGRSDGLRRSIWLEALGPSYVETALAAAHSADPQARLALSDYGLEYDDVGWMVEKRVTMLQLLRRLKSRGAPLHALSLQGHLIGERAPAFGRALRGFLGEVSDLGLEIYVTELDVDDRRMIGDPAQRDRQVADIYARFLEAVLSEPGVRMVNTWGLADRYTSKSFLAPRSDGGAVRPLPFDLELREKPAARSLRAAFLQAPRRA